LASSSLTFFSPLHRLEMIFSRIGADITRNTSAADSNTSSVSSTASAAAAPAAAPDGRAAVLRTGLRAAVEVAMSEGRRRRQINQWLLIYAGRM